MNISFYTAAVGAEQQQRRLDVHGNNIANVNNVGFRAKKPSFQALMTGPVRGIEEDLARGVGARMIGAETDFNQSGFIDTDRAFDYAIEGSGFFALQDPGTGEFSYTRDGSFTMSSVVVPVERTPEEQNELEQIWALQGEGETEEPQEPQYETKWYLSDGMGRFVLGQDGYPIEIDLEDKDAFLNVGVFDFVTYNGLQTLSENRFAPVEKNGQVRMGSGKLVQGCLEQSNTDLAYEFAKVVESQRSFSFLLRKVTTSDEIETTVNNLR